LAVEFAQPTLVVAGPIVEVVQRRLRKYVVSQLLTQAEQFVFQCLGKIGLPNQTLVWYDKGPIQKTGKQRRMRRIKQTPSRMILFEQIESEVIQLKYPLYARQRLS
jgi:hypothetical protein